MLTYAGEDEEKEDLADRSTEADCAMDDVEAG
jgi:hypothetical protein